MLVLGFILLLSTTVQGIAAKRGAVVLVVDCILITNKYLVGVAGDGFVLGGLFGIGVSPFMYWCSALIGHRVFKCWLFWGGVEMGPVASF